MSSYRIGAKRRRNGGPSTPSEVVDHSVEDAALFIIQAVHAEDDIEGSGGADMADVHALLKTIEAGKEHVARLKSLVHTDEVVRRGVDYAATFNAGVQEVVDCLRNLTDVARKRSPLLVDEVAEARERSSEEKRARVDADPPVLILGVKGARGPPSLTVSSPDSLRVLRSDLGMSLTAIATLMNESGWRSAGTPLVTASGLKNICQRLGIRLVEPKVVDEDVLTRFIEYWRNDNNNKHAGVTSLAGACDANNIAYTHRALERLLKAANPVASRMRHMQKIKRRVYSVVAANVLWHYDGNHKLHRWGLVIHGCIDGFSRRIMWLKISADNYASTVAGAFVGALTRYGAPRLVRSDFGLENSGVWRLVDEMRETLGYRINILRGRSVHNQRIERIWADVGRWIRATSEMLHA